MKKSMIRFMITAFVIITIGIGLFIGGIVAAGGLNAAKELLQDHGVYIERGIELEIDPLDEIFEF